MKKRLKKKVFIQFIECTKCKNTEEQSENESRHHMQCFRLTEYHDDGTGTYMCDNCGTINKSKIVETD